MKKHALIFVSLISSLILALSATPSLAQQTVYISDVLYVPLRSGAGIEYRIINAALKSGTQLTRIEQTENGDWSKVQTENGTEGWIRNQYISEEMTSGLRLNQALTKLARLEKSQTELNQTLASIKKENQSLKQQVAALSKTKSNVSNELDSLKQLSAGAVELDQNYRELLRTHEVTQTQRDSLTAENEQLKNDKSLTFMLYGAGILFLGMILAVVLPALKPKKGYSEWR